MQTFGDDVELGMSTGAFGDMSGAGPEVELCPLTTDTRPSSLGDDDSDCATFAYQWNTGSITGDVGREVEDLDVSIEADTDLHSDAPRDTETDEDGEFGWSGVQDGVYSIAVASSDDYTVKPKSVRVDVYHDEFEDDDDEDTDYIGTAGTDHADFSATKLRLSIKGYAANISHESNDVVRGDETYEGAELELFDYDEDSEDDIMSTGSVVATATVDADGLYEFNDIDEGAYVIVATNTDDYEMFADGPDVHYINNVAADTYKDDGVLEEQLTLPYWDYEASDVKNTRSPHTVGTGAAAESFTYYNFALLHGDGEFSGRVFEARGEPQGIAVELRRCETTTLDDADVVTDCREDTDFDAQTEDAGSKGRWDFPSLREGYYVANIAATTYNQAKWDDDGIDDDAANCEGGTAADAICDEARTVDMFGMLEGKSAFNRGGATFRVYNRTLGYDAELSGLVIEGTKDAEDGDEELEDFTVTDHDDGVANDIGTVGDPITYASESITLTPTLEDDNASVRVIVGDLDDPDDTGSGDDGDEIEVDLEMGENTVTVIVTAENAYDDRMYSFKVTRMAPVANTLADLGLRTTRDAETGTAIPINPTFQAGSTEYTATVPTGTATGTTMSVYVVATVRLLQQAITVTYSDGGTMKELEAEGQRNNDGTRQKVYKVTIPKTGALNDKSVLVKVTSEDGKALTYDIQLQRGEGDPTNAPPVFTSDDDFDVAENETAVGTVMATDADAEDDVTGYEITDGADMGQFKIDASTGELTFVSAPDFESPGDANEDNDYVVTVTATSGTGAREMTADQEITVTVTDDPADDDDPTGSVVTLTLDPTSIDEDGGMSTVTAMVSPASATAFDVEVSLNDDATDVALGNNTTLSFAADAAESTGDVTITSTDNSTDDGNQFVTVSGTTDATGVTVQDDVILVILEDDEAPGVPRDVEVTSGESGQVTLSWGYPRISGGSVVTGYEYQSRPNSGSNEPVDGNWSDPITGLTVDIVDRVDGLEYQFWVRAVNAAGPGEHVRVTGTSWPDVTAALDNDNISEGDDATTPDVEENVATLTITGGGIAVAAYSVSIATSGDDADGVELEMTEVTFQAGVEEVEVKVTAMDDALDNGDDDREVTIELDMVPAEAADREIDDLTITVTDDDEAPGSPASVTATADGSDKILVEWTAPSENGSADITHYEIRHVEGSGASDFEDDDGEDIGGWEAVAGDELTRAVRIEGLTAATAYVVQVRAVSSAGGGDPETETATTDS